MFIATEPYFFLIPYFHPLILLKMAAQNFGKEAIVISRHV
jgi:hypothetical protein